MNFEKIIKKLGKKQRMLLKVLLSRNIQTEDSLYIGMERFAIGLIHVGIVRTDPLSLTPKGRSFVELHGATLFDDIRNIEDDEFLQKYTTETAHPVK